MKTKQFLFILFAFLLNSIDTSAQTQAEMNQTAMEDYKKADAELNKVYKELMKTLGPKEKKLLIAAQKNWIKFRDSDCEFQAEKYHGGSIQPLIRYTCLTDRTQARTNDLMATKEEDK